MDLEDRHGLDDDANEVLSDLHPKKCPKSAGFCGAILMMTKL